MTETHDDTGLVAASLNGTDLTLDFQAEQNGTAQITVRATDGAGAFIEDTFKVSPSEDDIDLENLGSIGSITKLVERLVPST